MQRIALIIVYFGHWPEWIDLYFYSCEKNKNIDWFFYTDCAIPDKHYPNLYFNTIGFKDYCQKVSGKLNICFSPESPYKLCDLKPFYSIIHADIIKGYDFWGFADIDIVWGNIDKFYPNYLLEKYDVFSTHADRLSGHMALLRNIPKYTELCFQIKDWNEKLENVSNYALDENDFSHLICIHSLYMKKIYSKILRKLFNWRNAWVIYYHIVPIINALLRIRKHKLYFKEQHTTPVLADDNRTFKYDSELWHYRNGKIINYKTGNEHIYLHFMIYKKNTFRRQYFWNTNYYHLKKSYDFSLGVKISKTGFEPFITE